MNKWVSIILLVIISFVIVACGDKPKLEIIGISIDETFFEEPLLIGEYKLSDFKIIVEYEDGSTKNITIKESMIGEHLKSFYLIEGVHTIIVTYETFQVTFTVTMTAPQDKFTITFDTNEGSSLEQLTQAKYTLIIWPQNPTKEGFVFAGWYSDEDLELPFESTQMPDENLTLYAKWEVLILTVTFMIDQETMYSQQQVSYGEAVSSIDDATKEGYTFKGWNQPLNEIKTNLVVFAIWEINTYTLTFETFDGDLIPPIELNFGTTIERPEDPNKEGYIFDEWYIDQTFTTPYEFGLMPATHLTIYARFVLPTSTINFETFGGSHIEPLVAVVGSEIHPPTEPTKFGYAFDGWYLDDQYTTLFVFNLMPETEFVLYAKWEDLQLDPLNFLSMTPFTTIESQEALTNYIAYMMFHKLDRVELTIDYTFQEGNEIVNEIQAALHMSHKHIHILKGMQYSYNENTNFLVLVPSFDEEAYLSASEENAFIQRPFYDMHSSSSRSEDFNTFKIYDWPHSYPVETSEQLYYVMSRGYRPEPLLGSTAETFYESAKIILRNIIDDQMTDIEKLHKIQSWIVEHVVYDIALSNMADQNLNNLHAYKGFYLEGIFHDLRAVCDGFAKMFVILAALEGFEVFRVIGQSIDPSVTSLHAWNKVKVDGLWYIIDTTSANIIMSNTYEVYSNRFFMISDTQYASHYVPLSDFDVLAEVDFNIYEDLMFEYEGITYSRAIDSLDALKTLLLYYNQLNQFTMSIDVYIDFECDTNFLDCLFEAFQGSGLPRLEYSYRQNYPYLIIWVEDEMMPS